MQIAEKTVVAIDYKLKDETGEIIDQSEAGHPLHYLHGVGQIVPGLEVSLNGKSAGDEFTVTLDPDHAYGPHDPELIRSISLDLFDEPESLQPGLQFDMPFELLDEEEETEGSDEEEFDEEDFLLFTILEINDTEVIADGNHELAGKKLTFDVSVREVREATAEELDHGHAHGPDMEPH